MADAERLAKLSAALNARQYADVRLSTSEITDLCYLHGFLTDLLALAGKLDAKYDEERFGEAVSRLGEICERAVGAEELH